MEYKAPQLDSSSLSDDLMSRITNTRIDPDTEQSLDPGITASPDTHRRSFKSRRYDGYDSNFHHPPTGVKRRCW